MQRQSKSRVKRADFIGRWMGPWWLPLNCSVSSCLKPAVTTEYKCPGVGTIKRLLHLHWSSGCFSGTLHPCLPPLCLPVSVSSVCLHISVLNTSLVNLLLPPWLSFIHCSIHLFPSSLLSIYEVSFKQAGNSGSVFYHQCQRKCQSHRPTDLRSKEHLCLHRGCLANFWKRSDSRYFRTLGM